MSVPTAELATPAVTPLHRPRRASLTAGRTGSRFYLALIGAALAAGALSLLIPSTPSYDPWSWILWGREILHGNLQTTGGPTWKPLPMPFTTVFALFGKAAPDLWLVVARAGALMAVVMVFKVAATLTHVLGTRLGAAGELANAGVAQRVVALMPALLAGSIAAVSLALNGGFLSDSALGYSEGLASALMLIAVERHLDGRPRQAFAIGFGAALDRPEIWLFWGPYGLWLAWRDPGARKLVLALFALIPVLWFVPEYWGSGHLLRGVTRAHQPRSNSSAFANCPFCSELVDHAWPWVLLRVKVAAALAAGVAAWLLWRRHRERGVWRLQSTREHALAATIAAALIGLAWFVLIALMTQAGFSGNDRYLVIGAALIDIAGGAGFGWAASELAATFVRRERMARPAARRYGPSWAATALLGLIFIVGPNWIGANLIDIPHTHRAIVYQAHLREDLDAAVRRLGGSRHVLACGSVMTENFEVPMVAYALGVHILRVQSGPLPGQPDGLAPNVIFETAATRSTPRSPLPGEWPSTHYRLVADVRTFSVYASCAGNVGL